MSTLAVDTLTLLLLTLLSAAASIPSPTGKGSSSSLAIYSVTPAQWAASNSSIGGRLGAGRSINMPCFSNYNGTVSTPDMELAMAQKPRRQVRISLRIILEAMNMQVFLESLLDSTLTLIQANWSACQATSQSCYLSSTLTYDPITPLLGTYYQGSVPNYYFEVQQVSEVQKTMEFAQELSIPLAVKNTGHDYKGRSSAPTVSLYGHTIIPLR